MYLSSLVHDGLSEYKRYLGEGSLLTTLPGIVHRLTTKGRKTGKS